MKIQTTRERDDRLNRASLSQAFAYYDALRFADTARDHSRRQIAKTLQIGGD